MLTPSRTRTLLPTLAALVVAAALCEVVAHATKHGHGVAGLVSWVTWLGFWAILVAAVAVVALLAIGVVRGRGGRS